MIEKVETLEQVASLHLKGYKNAEIARELDITPVQVKYYIGEYREFLKTSAMEDPDFLDRLAENTLQALEEINMVYKETWEAYEKAKHFEIFKEMAWSLKLLSDISEKKAKLLQLMGAKVDNGSMARMQRAEQVNEIVSGVIKEVISECNKCRGEAQIRLAEAFEIMNKVEDAVDMEPIEDDIEEAEVV